MSYRDLRSAMPTTHEFAVAELLEYAADYFGGDRDGGPTDDGLLAYLSDVDVATIEERLGDNIASEEWRDVMEEAVTRAWAKYSAKVAA